MCAALVQIPQPVALEPYRGALALTGDGLRAAFQRMCPAARAPAHPLHITLFTPRECKQLGPQRLVPSSIPICTEHLYVLPPASKASVCWLPVVWNHADAWRKSLGLAPKAYHMTLSDTDDHSLDKSIAAYVRSTGQLDELVEQAAQISPAALDHLSAALRALPNEAMRVAERMVVLHPDSARGYVRLGDAATLAAEPQPKLAALAYAQAARLDPSLLDYASRRIRRSSSTISYGPLVTAQEQDAISPSLRPHLLRPWPPDLDAMLSPILWTAPAESRQRQMYLGYELPRFFSWVYPGRVAGMSTPRHARDVDALVDMGITHVLTLTQEEPLSPAWFHLKPLEHIYIPVPNYGAPTLGEMDAILTHFRAGGTWLVHCGGGVGRAGTVLACLVAMLGRAGEGQDGSEPQLDARTAITLLRRTRPRSLESKVQEQFVASFVSHRWKRAYERPQLPEPVSALRTVHAHRGGQQAAWDARLPTVLFLVGKPGSGKSWLATAIAKRRGKTLVIRQDGSGRAACENQLGRSQPDDTLVIFDRCNPSREDRALWLRLIPAGRQRIVVYFDYQSELCLQRINMRLNHPTVRTGAGGNAVRQADRMMDVPDPDAEGFDTMLVVSSFVAAREALVALTPPLPLLKFPRTPHLLNLGAVTDDDEVLQDFDLLTGPLTVEEKIDGANLGFSLDVHGAIQVQNRSHWVSAADHVQFKPLTQWLDEHGAALVKLLARDTQFLERYILYGEWVVARHSVHYTRLPDRFLAFDLYDRLRGTFVSRAVLASALRGSGIAQVPLLAQTGSVSRTEVLAWINEPSAFSAEKREGVYVRFEDAARTHTVRRGKIVRADFIAGNEHWSKGRIVFNRLAS